jgi:transcriptional regulator GlxA family with amidase domain
MIFKSLLLLIHWRRTAVNIPQGRKIRVAFTLAAGTQVIDMAGPWEVFQDVRVEGECPFELYTVGATIDLLLMSGGMQIVPNYAVDNAPQQDSIISPAHANCPSINLWLRRASADTAIIASVCTGVNHLAEADLLDGLTVTTYHSWFDSFEERFPRVKVHRHQRFIDQGHAITAGGMTACIDMSLHIVKRYFGYTVARNTAKLLEYEGHGWRQSSALKQSRLESV